jgi:cyclic-di-GMP-binding protein
MPPPALPVPAERGAPPSALELRPKSLKAWLEALPLAQTIDAARQLDAYVEGLNASRVPPDVRGELLETVRPFALTLLEELDDIYAKSAQPLGPRGRDAVMQARTLAAHLALGYRIAAVDVAAKRIAFGQKKQLTQLLVRSVDFLAVPVRASYKAYSPVPPGTWKALHEAYLYSEAEGIATEPGDAETQLTVAQVYCETLLLALTDAYRLAPGELDRVVGQVRTLRAPVTLTRVRPQTRPGAHFIVPCDTDRPPKPALSANDDTGGPNFRIFDANAIVERLRVKKQAIDAGHVSATTTKALGDDGAQLLAKLIVLWGDPPKRAYRRDPSDITVAICVGIKAIAHFVSHDAHEHGNTRAGAVRKGITMPLRALGDEDTSRAVPIYEWAVVNQSAGGLKVKRAHGAMQPLAVGDIVGIRAPGKARWTIAIARWITTLDDGGAEFGLQYVGQAVRGVWIQAAVASTPQGKQGLLIDDEDEPGTQMLAAPASTWSELREFELQDTDFLQRVRAADVIEQTGRFDLFRVCAS